MSKLYYLVQSNGSKKDLGTKIKLKDVCDRDLLRKTYLKRIVEDETFRTKTLGWGNKKSVEDYVNEYKARIRIGGRFIKSEDQSMITDLYELGDVVETKKQGAQVRIRMKDGKLKWFDRETYHDPPLICSYDSQHDGPVEKLPEDVSDVQGFGEAALLVVMRRRFVEMLNIYTYVGDIVLCINPYIEFPAMVNIDEPPCVKTFEMGRDPHSYATAHFAYWNQFDPNGHPSEHRDQSCIVSGESGAGKTVACSKIMKYLSKLSQWRCDELKLPANDRNITDMVGGVSPFFEAFGNAKTALNDNSSRFGKFQKILFENGTIVGAHAESYLLEKSRLTFQGPNERSFHSFYFLCAGATVEERRVLNLKPAHEYRFVTVGCKKNNGRCDPASVLVEHETRADGTNTHDFDMMNNPVSRTPHDQTGCRAAMSSIGIDEKRQGQIWTIVAAILKMGELDFVASPAATGEIKSIVASESRERCKEITNLLGLDHLAIDEGLAAMLCIKRIKVPGEGEIDSGMSPSQSAKQRDALAKDIYSRLFDYLFRCVNEALRPREHVRVDAFIGILDIFGFEVFGRNGMDQLCINFANEKLQKMFNDHVFTRERIIYEREGLSKDIIPPYRDNTPCCDLIERCTTGFVGILPSLDEKSTKLNATDTAWCGQVIQRFGRDTSTVPKELKSRAARSSAKYLWGKKGAGNDWFVVRHFAGDVRYHVKGWLEKNNDKFPCQLPSLMRKSRLDIVRDLYTTQRTAHTRGRRRPKYGTIACKFVMQLQSLAATLSRTTPHYVRCVKPNDVHMRPIDGLVCFDAFKTYRQLLYAGVMEACRIKKDGYPFRESFDLFWKNRVLPYRWNKLLRPSVDDDATPVVKGIRRIFQHVLPGTVRVGKRGEEVERPQWCVGTTMIFAKDYALARIEEWAKREVASTVLRWWRVNALQRRVREFEMATRRIQRLYRRELLRREAEHLVVVLQKAWRSYILREGWRTVASDLGRIETIERAAVAVQRTWNNWCAGRRWARVLASLRILNAARVAQRVVRSYRAYDLWRASARRLRQSRTEALLDTLRRGCLETVAKIRCANVLRRKLLRLRRLRVTQARVRFAVAIKSLRVQRARNAEQRVAAGIAQSLHTMRLTRIYFAAAAIVVVRGQALWRGYRARLRFRHALVCVRRIQRQFRRFRVEAQVVKRLYHIVVVQQVLRRRWIERITEARADATHILERFMYRHLRQKRLRDWIVDTQSAVASGNLDSVRLLMSCPKPFEVLRPQLCETLPGTKPHNALVNVRDRVFFDSFLHVAVGAPNSAAIAKYLIGLGADPEAANFRGSTVVHDSVSRGDDCLELTELLIRHCSTSSVCNSDLLYVLSFECNRFDTSHVRREAMAKAFAMRYPRSSSVSRKVVHNGECIEGETVLGAAIRSSRPSASTLKLLQSKSARASRFVKMEQREREMCEEAWEHEDRETERERDRSIYEALRRSDAFKFLELAIAGRNFQSYAVGVSRIMRFIRAWRERRTRIASGDIPSSKRGEETFAPRGRTKTAAMVMSELLDALENDDDLEEICSRHRSVANIVVERHLTEEKISFEEVAHRRAVAAEFRQRLFRRNEERRNRRRNHARARAESAHRKYDGPLMSSSSDLVSDSTSQYDLHESDLFGSKLDLIGLDDDDDDSIENGQDMDRRKKRELESVLPSDQSYHYRKYMTKHRISTLLQEIPDDILDDCAVIDTEEDVIHDSKPSSHPTREASVWMPLKADQFESTLEIVDGDAPLDPPGVSDAIDEVRGTSQLGWTAAVDLDDEETTVVPPSPAVPPGIVPPMDNDDVSGDGRKIRSLSVDTDEYVRVANESQPRYRGDSVFDGVPGATSTVETKSKSPTAVWSSLLRPQFGARELEDASFPMEPPGTVRRSSMTTDTYVTNSPKSESKIHPFSGDADFSDDSDEVPPPISTAYADPPAASTDMRADPPGALRRRTVTTEAYVLNSPKHENGERRIHPFTGEPDLSDSSDEQEISVEDTNMPDPPGQLRRSTKELTRADSNDSATTDFVVGDDNDVAGSSQSSSGDSDNEEWHSADEESKSPLKEKYPSEPPGMMSQAKVSTPGHRNPLMSVATREYVQAARTGRPIYRGNSVFHEVKRPQLTDSSESEIESPPRHSMGPRRPSAVFRALRLADEEDESAKKNHDAVVSEVKRSGEHRRASLDAIAATKETSSKSASSTVGSTIPARVVEEDVRPLLTPKTTSASVAPSDDWRRRFLDFIFATSQRDDDGGAPLWEYVDTKGVVHGPFTSRQMRFWFEAGHLSAALRVRLSSTDRVPIWRAPFVPIRELFRPVGDAFVINKDQNLLDMLRLMKQSIRSKLNSS